MTNVTSLRRGRARRACLCCRARKIRCNVMEESPCSNCRLDSVSCVVSRKRRNRKIFASIGPDDKPLQKELSSAEPRLSLLGQQSSSITQSLETNFEVSMPNKSLITHFPAFIQTPSTRLSTIDIQYLGSKGALRLPTFPTQCALLESFIEHAYHYLPVVNIKTLLAAIHDQEEHKISLLLYQAILFSGCAFVDCDSLPQEDPDFRDRRTARSLLAHRVTLLYDLDYETDKLLLMQTCLLMSTSSDVPSNRKDPGYWSSVAINHAYSIGLNQDLGPQNLSSAELKLRKRLWWTCLMRDRLLALGLHRPTRIKSCDFNTLDLRADDFDYITLDDSHYLVGPQCPSLKTFDNQHLLAEICKHRAQLGSIIEDVLALQSSYGAVANPEAYQQLHEELAENFLETEKRLEDWKEALPKSCRLDSLPKANTKSLHVLCSHMHLLYYTVVYSLHRPRFLPTSPTMISAAHHATSTVSRAKTVAAAAYISEIAAKLNESRLDRYLPISGLTVVFPAIIVSLLQLKWANACSPEAITHLHACATVVKTMQQTYATADDAIAYLNVAMQKSSLNTETKETLSTRMSLLAANEVKDRLYASDPTKAKSILYERGDQTTQNFDECEDYSMDLADFPAVSIIAEDVREIEDVLSLRWDLEKDDNNEMYDSAWPPCPDWSVDTSFLENLLDIDAGA